MAPRDNTAEHEAQAAEPDRPVTMTVRLPSEILDGIERDAGTDPEAVLRWLETGEGEPWREF